ncbi:Ig-like domain-containing protein [Paenibacillus macerans]|uniref:Ig-like domain-containing protein n=1 Tax=Paenibacillus macerans TaxID=44252 RepID=UPI003D31E407
MSNTSYSFKENSHVIVNQGGEKKVMKKILSVALSTAMAFSMFASVAFGADAQLTPEQQFNALKEAGIVSGFPDGLSHLEKTLTRAELAKIIVNSMSLEPVDATSYNDKNYANHWGRTYIEAATQAGILNGKDATKKLFDPNGAVTVQELAKVLVTALKLEVPTDANNTASAWAKGYVAAAVQAGFLADGINYQAQATRSQAVVAAYAIYEAAQVPTVKSYEVKDSKNIEFTLSTDEVVKVTLETALEANKETEVTFKTAAGEEITAKVTWVLTTATKVESVSASNLKEVVVTFDGEVDKGTAEEADNYTLNKGLNVESATLSADKKSVTLSLDVNNGGHLDNQKEYQLDVANIKAGDKVISVSDYKFTPLDNTLPNATAVQALGNKTVKLTFSEPIEKVSTSDVTIDGKTALGYPEISGNVVIYKLYTKLENAEHTIAIKNVQDYAEFKSAPQELTFSVVEDTQAPTVASVLSATFETVRIQFSEPVDKSTVSGANVYWLQGSSKKYASTKMTQISDDTYEFDFTANKLQYATALYISGVKDYSGNAIANDTKVEVNPVVDQTRPEVVNAELESDNKTFKIKFNKSLDETSAETKGNYIIRDADGNEVRKTKTPTLTDSKTVSLVLTQALEEGKTYTLEIAGVTDATLLKNSVLPYSKKFVVSDNSAAIASVYVDSTANEITVTYDKEMVVAGEGSIANLDNYLYATVAGQWKNLPDSTDYVIGADSKSITIKVDSDDLLVSTITNFRVQLVKSINDKYLSNISQDFSGTGLETIVRPQATGIEVTDNNKLEIAFDKNLLAASVNASDFEVKDGSRTLSVASASLKDNNKVVLTLSADEFNDNGTGKTSNANPTVTVVANPRTSTSAGWVITSGAVGGTFTEKIAASLNNVLVVDPTLATNTVFTLQFSEALDPTVDLGDVATDLVVKDSNGDDLAFTVTAVGGTGTETQVQITLGAVYDGVATVEVKDDARFLKDLTGSNTVSSSDVWEFEM